MTIDISLVNSKIQITRDASNPHIYGVGDEHDYYFDTDNQFHLTIRSHIYIINFSDLTVGGVAPANVGAAYTALAAVFPNPNSGSGGSGSGYAGTATNYAGLPDPTLHSGEFYYVINSQGTKWLPGTLGGTYYKSGTYYSNGTSWVTDVMPNQAAQSDVDAGTVTDQFVTPATLKNYAGWAAIPAATESGTSLKLGSSTVQNTTKNVIIGQSSTGQGINSTVIGANSNGGQNCIISGNDNFTSSTTVNNLVLISTSATNTKTSAQNAIVIAPVYTAANGEGIVAIGRDMNVTCTGASSTSANQGVYIGKGVTHTAGANAAAIIIGRNNNGQDGTSPILIGSGITTASGLQNSVVIGASAITQDGQSNTVVIGTGAKAYLDGTYGSSGNGQVAIGETAFSGAWRATAIGGHAQALAVSSNAIGYGGYVNAAHGTTIGRGGYMDKSNSILFYTGGTGLNFYFGGVAAAWNNPAMPGGEVVDQSTNLNAGTIISRIWGISGRDANATPTLTNVKGGHLRLIGGAGTGTAQGGDVGICVCLAGGVSNNTENSETVMMKILGATGETQFQNGGTYTSIPSAQVAINSTTKGFLFPRMTTTQRDAISSPATGLSIFNTSTNTFNYYNGSAWVQSFANTSGVLAVASGGSGQSSYTDGQLLIGNTSGNTLSKATLTAGTGITITNGNGSITIAATGGGGGAVPNGGTTGQALIKNSSTDQDISWATIKPTTQVISSSDWTDTTGSLTDVMSVAVGANKVYKITAELFIGCNNTGGIKFALTAPTGSAIRSGIVLGNSSTASSVQQSRLTALATGTAAFNIVNAQTGNAIIIAYITTSTTTGNITLQAAAGVATQTASVKIGSTFEVFEVL